MIVVAAHGTRDTAGPAVIEALADGVRTTLPGETVRVAYADVRAPSVADVLSEHLGERAVVVPAFLAAGYHVRTDIPQQIAASAHPRTVLADAFGPAPELVAVLVERLVAAGYRTGDGVVLAAAGSSDHRALVDVHDTAYALGVRLGAPVRVGFAATARPSVSDAVASLRAARQGVRVAVASWLLAPGLFQCRLDDAGAEVTANPLGAHPRVVDLIVRRHQAAVGAFVAA